MLMSASGSGNWEALPDSMETESGKEPERSGAWPLQGVYEDDGSDESVGVWCGWFPWWAGKRKEPLFPLLYDRANRRWGLIPREPEP